MGKSKNIMGRIVAKRDENLFLFKIEESSEGYLVDDRNKIISKKQGKFY